jgi:hypothetical protein
LTVTIFTDNLHLQKGYLGILVFSGLNINTCFTCNPILYTTIFIIVSQPVVTPLPVQDQVLVDLRLDHKWPTFRLIENEYSTFTLGTVKSAVVWHKNNHYTAIASLIF